MKDIQTCIEREVEKADKMVEQFQQHLSSDALFALQQSNEVFRAVAYKSVALTVKKQIEDNISVKHIVKSLDKQIHSSARFPGNSTTTANLINSYILSANAYFAEVLEEMIEE